MTLVLAALGFESIWLLTDRRLSWPRHTRDDARKTMFLDTPDGLAMLGYAGLGRTSPRGTSPGTEPASWMCAVLGNRRWSLEGAFGAISAAMQRQLPRHIAGLTDHHVVAPAYVNDEARLYTIDLMHGADGKKLHPRYTRYVAEWPSGAKTHPRVGLSGTGGIHLGKRKSPWMRELLNRLDAHDRKALSSLAMADYLAKLNNTVHLEMRSNGNNSVGPRCIISWRFRKAGIHEGGGGHQFYTGEVRDAASPALPSLVTHLGARLDILLEAMTPDLYMHFEAQLAGKAAKFDEEALKRALERARNRISPEPDEELK